VSRETTVNPVVGLNSELRFIRLLAITNQSIIVWTLRTKSLLPSLYKREEFALFGKLIFTHKRGGWTQGAMLYAVNMKK
jgi:hypothetical protein